MINKLLKLKNKINQIEPNIDILYPVEFSHNVIHERILIEGRYLNIQHSL